MNNTTQQYSVVSKSEIESKYQDRDLVEKYEKRRFSHPYWAMSQDKEVAIVSRAIKQAKPNRLLEIAVGTARIARNIPHEYFNEGYALDSSPEMLEVSTKLLDSSKWKVISGDAMNLDFPDDYFDAVMTFRFIRHFQMEDRKKIYESVARVLRPNGYLIFEAFNKNLTPKASELIGLGGKKGIYDELWTRESLEKELDDNGFKVVKLIPYLHHIDFSMKLGFLHRGVRKIARAEFIPLWKTMHRAIDLIPSKHFIYWEVVCQKK